jgi:hypothetical protein
MGTEGPLSCSQEPVRTFLLPISEFRSYMNIIGLSNHIYLGCCVEQGHTPTAYKDVKTSRTKDTRNNMREFIQCQMKQSVLILLKPGR